MRSIFLILCLLPAYDFMAVYGDDRALLCDKAAYDQYLVNSIGMQKVINFLCTMQSYTQTGKNEEACASQLPSRLYCFYKYPTTDHQSQCETKCHLHPRRQFILRHGTYKYLKSSFYIKLLLINDAYIFISIQISFSYPNESF